MKLFASMPAGTCQCPDLKPYFLEHTHSRSYFWSTHPFIRQTGGNSTGEWKGAGGILTTARVMPFPKAATLSFAEPPYI
jgi:hypothetical protein